MCSEFDSASETSSLFSDVREIGSNKLPAATPPAPGLLHLCFARLKSKKIGFKISQGLKEGSINFAITHLKANQRRC
jgi:hypothetical protein